MLSMGVGGGRGRGGGKEGERGMVVTSMHKNSKFTLFLYLDAQ